MNEKYYNNKEEIKTIFNLREHILYLMYGQKLTMSFFSLRI